MDDAGLVTKCEGWIEKVHFADESELLVISRLSLS